MTVSTTTTALARALLAIEKLEAKLAAAERTRHEPIAVVGIGCRFPGGAASPAAFWSLLDEGRDAVREVPPERWPLARWASQPAVRRAGFLDEVDGFDAAFFNISPREARTMDPQQRLLLEVAYEALEDAGQPLQRLGATRTGVFIGATTPDYQQKVLGQELDTLDMYGITGSGVPFLAGRLAYAFGLQGPCMVVDTACSSSLVAVHLAVQSLRAGESDLVLAGGVNVLASPLTMHLIAQSQALSPDGRCRTFDARANGFVRGEGCGVVVLKRLTDARRDGDRVWAVIRGSAVNQDGRSTGLTAPNVKAQEALLRRALADAGGDAAEIGYVEAHGTGTKIGDPIEVEALRAVLGAGEAPCRIGSVKTNVGHLEAAAGIAGFVKVVLSLYHGSIPRQLHFERLNPLIRLEGTRLAIASEAAPWPSGRRLAGVSAFGMSGTNAHVVVEAAEPAAEPPVEADDGTAQLIVLSGRSRAAVQAMAGQWAARVEADGGLAPADVAATAALRRSEHEQRAAVVAANRGELIARLQSVAAGEAIAEAAGTPPKVVFIYPGQGSQWLGMGRTLWATEPVFRDALATCGAAIEAYAGWSLERELHASEAESRLARLDVVQPALFAVSVALSALWRSWGVEPSAVVGHSMGEVAAAFVAGALPLADAVRVICARSQQALTIAGQGGMMVVELPQAEAQAALRGYEAELSVAASNSPRATVISGALRALDELQAELGARGVFCRRVQVDFASHSPQVDRLRPALLAELRGIAPRRGDVPMLSTVTGEPCDGQALDADYWVRNLREPVQLWRAIDALLSDGHTQLVEVSPHPVLVPGLEAMVRERGGNTFGSLRRGQPERAALLETLGGLWAQGVAVRWEAVTRRRRPVALPSYAWQHERFWLETSARRASHDADASAHPLLGVELTTAAAGGARVWQHQLGGAAHAYLLDHRVGDAAIFPATGYLALAVAAARELSPATPVVLEEVAFDAALPLVEGERRVVEVAVREDAAAWRFAISSRRGDESAWIRHASGRIAAPSPATPTDAATALAVVRARCAEVLDGERFYAGLGAHGWSYGPAFRGVAELRVGAGEAVARLRPADSTSRGALDPARWDAAFQALLGIDHAKAGAAGPGVPTRLERLELAAPEALVLWSHGRSRRDGQQEVGDLTLFDEAGARIGELRGLHVTALPGAARTDAVAPWLGVAWRPAPPSEASPAVAGSRRWLVVADADGPGRSIAAELARRGELVATAGSADALDARVQGPAAPAAVVVAAAAPAEEDPDPAWLARAHARLCGAILGAAQALARAGGRERPRLYVVTHGAQNVAAAGDDGDVDVTQAAAWGLARTVANEHPELRPCCIDLGRGATAVEVSAAVDELLRDGGEEEVTLRGDERFVGRIVRATAPDAGERVAPAAGRPFVLQPGRAGGWDDLALRETVRHAPGPGEVEVEVQAVGLNFTDVLKVLGVYPTDDPAQLAALGSECAGRVVAVGPGVDELRVGQEVVAIAPRALGSHVIAPASAVLPRPATLDPAAAASVPLVFMTAFYAIHELARLRAGERILIHSAAGGVGLAAIQIARRLGAEIFATAGTPEKRAFLTSLGVAHVMDSRALDFVDQIRQATAGAGVDVVINSLSGRAIEASLAVLASDGRFVELGKRDIYDGQRALALAPFKRRISFHAVDLAGLGQERPERFVALFREVMAAFARGELAPSPLRVFDMAEAGEAIRTLSLGRHTGKLVVARGEADPPIRSRAGLRADATYLITGGLGGLGLSLARWMVSAGARHLVLVGRRGADTPERQEAVRALEGAGATVRVARVDVADRAELAALLRSVAAEMPPLEGVVHAAAVLDDAMLLEQNVERFARVFAPKVAGAWNLHTLTRELPLSFFVLYGSAASLFGPPGQASYAAANAFLDALAQHRRSRGLPALSIGWGGFSEVGLAAAGEQRGARLGERGMGSFTPDEGNALFARLLGADVAAIAVARVSLRHWVEFYPHAAASARLEELRRESRIEAQARAMDATLRAALLAAEGPAQAAVLEEHVRALVARVLRLDAERVGTRTPLTTLGIDSLMGLELRNRLEATLGLTLSATLIWKCPTVAAIAAHLADKLELKPAAPAPAPEAPTADELATLSTLTPDEKTALLEREVAALEEMLS